MKLVDRRSYKDETKLTGVLHLWTFNAAGKVARFRHYVDTAKHLAVAAGLDATAH